MLPLQKLINQLSTMQSLQLERMLQKTVSFDSKSLLVFNSLMLGLNKEEIIRECSLNDDNYPKYERPIYNCLLELYGLTPITAKDEFMNVIYYAINELEDETDEKAFNLEKLFHELTKHNIEQEATEILFSLYKLHIGTPLQTVYYHLYSKYNEINQANANAFDLFEELNNLLDEYLTGNQNQEALHFQIRNMIKVYKEIRNLYHAYENRTLLAILNNSKLILTSICGQKQLLKDQNISVNELYTLCQKNIVDLPFGIERYFLKNIYDQLKILTLVESNSSKSLNYAFPLMHKRFSEAHNFGFPKKIFKTIGENVNQNKGKRAVFKLLKINPAVFKGSQQSLLNVNFSGDPVSMPST